MRLPVIILLLCARAWSQPATLNDPLTVPLRSSTVVPPPPDCVLWLKAEGARYADIGKTMSASTNGAPVRVWSGVGGVDATNFGGASMPYLTNNALRGHASVHFDGVDDWLGAPASITSTGLTFFVVGRRLGQLGSPRFAGLHYGPDDVDYDVAVKAVLLYAPSSDTFACYRGAPMSTVSGVTQSGFNYGMSLFTGSSNLITWGASRGNYVPSTGNFGSYYLLIGGFWTGGVNDGFLQGDIVEMLLYARALSDSEQAVVTNYLKSKFGL